MNERAVWAQRYVDRIAIQRPHPLLPVRAEFQATADQVDAVMAAWSRFVRAMAGA